jgi:DNA-binding transcriptional ArsR family regulator
MDAIALTFAKAIADETRQQIMDCICCQWCSVNDVVDRLGGRVNQPTVSHHLKLLHDAGLVEVRQEGRQRFYTVDQTRVTACCNALVRQFAPDFAQFAVIPMEAITVKD